MVTDTIHNVYTRTDSIFSKIMRNKTELYYSNLCNPDIFTVVHSFLTVIANLPLIPSENDPKNLLYHLDKHFSMA